MDGTDPRIHGAGDGAHTRHGGIAPLPRAALVALLAAVWAGGPAAPAGAQEALPPEGDATVSVEAPAAAPGPAPEAAPAAIAVPEAEAPAPSPPQGPMEAPGAPAEPVLETAPAAIVAPEAEAPAPEPAPAAALPAPAAPEGTEDAAEAAVPAASAAPAPVTPPLAPKPAKAAAPKPPPPPPEEPPRPRVDWRKVQNPVAATEASIGRGRDIYNGKGLCNVCHGDKGDGFGPVRGQFSPFPNGFFDPGWHKATTDGQIMGVLQEGKYGTGMVRIVPDFLTEAEGWDVINFLRTFQGKTTEAYERYQAFLRDNPNGPPPADVLGKGAAGPAGPAEAGAPPATP